jgi:hypothetical protein
MQARRLALAAILALACGHAQIPDTAFEPGKLDAPTAAQLDAARAKLADAQGELTRTGAGIGAAREQRSLAEADQKVAEAERERVKKLVDQAEARRRAADARRAFGEKLVEAREGAQDAAKSRVDLADAQLQLVKLETLERTNAGAAKGYDKADFYERVTRSQRKVDDAAKTAREREDAANEAERRWQELSRQVPAE